MVKFTELGGKGVFGCKEVGGVRSKFIPYKIYTYTVSLFIMIKGKEGFRHT